MKYLIFISLLFFLVSCNHDEGEGGRSTIIGKIFVQDFDSDGLLKDEYYPGDWDVFIIYGNDEVYGDSQKTHFDGTFIFEYLYEGSYTVFAYSKCKSCPGEREIISVEVELGSKETLRLEDIIVID